MLLQYEPLGGTINTQQSEEFGCSSSSSLTAWKDTHKVTQTMETIAKKDGVNTTFLYPVVLHIKVLKSVLKPPAFKM